MKIYWNGERKNVIGSRVKELRKKQDIHPKSIVKSRIAAKILLSVRKRELYCPADSCVLPYGTSILSSF